MGVLLTLIVFILSLLYAFYHLKLRFSYSVVWAFVVDASLIYFALVLNQNIASPLIFVFFISLSFLVSRTFPRLDDRNGNEFFSKFKTELFLYLLGVILILGVPSNFRFLAWDELSAWANRSKFIFERGSLWHQGDLEFFPFYPPILNTLHQIFLPLSSVFDESLVLRTQVLLTFAVLVSLLRILPYRNFFLRFVVLMSIISIPYFFGFTYYNAYPDLLLGLLFALSIAIVLHEKNFEVRILMLVPLLFFVVLLKPTGIFFAISTIFLLLTKYGLKIDSLRESIFYLTSALAAYVSWQIYCIHNHLNTSNFTPINFVLELWKDISGSDAKSKIGLNGLSQQTNSGFAIARKMFSDYVDGDVKFILPIFVFAGLFCILYSVKLKYVYFAILVYIGYEVLLFFTYVNLMSGYEAENTASHSRYLATLLMPLVIVCFMEFTSKSTFFSTILFSLVVILCSLLLSRNSATEITGGQPYRDGLPARDQTFQLFNSVKVPENSKLMYLEQNAPSLGYTRLLFSYHALPSRTSLGCWSWGDPYYDGDIWTCSASGLLQYLELYDYIFVESADEIFFSILDRSGISYDEKLQRGVYKIHKEDALQIKLQSIFVERTLR